MSLLILTPLVNNIQSLSEYAAKIVKARMKEAPHLLPDLLDQYPIKAELANKLPHLLVDQVNLVISIILLQFNQTHYNFF